MKQVDILISKNHAQQLLYLKHHVSLYEISNHTVQYKLLQHNKTQTYWPAFEAVNDEYTSSYALLTIRY